MVAILLLHKFLKIQAGCPVTCQASTDGSIALPIFNLSNRRHVVSATPQKIYIVLHVNLTAIAHSFPKNE
jgi:hypothetical protein